MCVFLSSYKFKYVQITNYDIWEDKSDTGKILFLKLIYEIVSMNEPFRYSDLVLMSRQTVCHHTLKEIDCAFLLGTVSGFGMGLLTELYKAEKSFLRTL